MELISSCQHIKCAFTFSGVENHSTPALRDAGHSHHHQGTRDSEEGEISAVQFKVPWLHMLGMETT